MSSDVSQVGSSVSTLISSTAENGVETKLSAFTSSGVPGVGAGQGNHVSGEKNEGIKIAAKAPQAKNNVISSLESCVSDQSRLATELRDI